MLLASFWPGPLRQERRLGYRGRTGCGRLETLAFLALPRGLVRRLELGDATYIFVLTAELAYQQAALLRVQAQAARYTDTAALFQALGGGWWNRDAIPRDPAARLRCRPPTPGPGTKPIPVAAR